MTISPTPTLSRAQREYVSDVNTMLRPLPRRIRDDLLDTLRQNLAERGRPAACSDPHHGAPQGVTPDYWPDELAEIQRALGTPAEYAAALLADAEQAEPGFTAQSRRRHHRNVALVSLLTATLIAGVIGGAAWWVTWTPGFAAPMSRVCVAFQSDSSCGQDGVTDLSPANMLKISCVADRTLFITVGLTADSSVTVTGASFAGGIGVGNARPNDIAFSDQMFRVDAITPWTRPAMQDRAAPSHWPIAVGPEGMLPEVHFTLTMCPKDGVPRALPGGGTVVPSFELYYRAYGRNRVATVDFMDQIAIEAPQ